MKTPVRSLPYNQEDPGARLIVIIGLDLDGLVNYFDTTIGKHLEWLVGEEETELPSNKLHKIHVLTDEQPEDVNELALLKPDTWVLYITQGKPRETLAEWKTANDLINHLS